MNIPVSDAGPVYYSCKLCVYNLTVYEACSPNNAYCFAWTENNGNRGSCEIGTALLEWFKTLPGNVKEVSVFSDTCGGQNRNQYIASLFLYITQTLDITVVEHKFMEKGHSKMEVDCMHSAIEHAEKNITITSMRQWLTVFSMARSNRNRHKIKNKKPMKEAYRVKELKYSDFKDLKALGAIMIKNRTQDIEKKTVQWLKIKRMSFKKADSNLVFF